MWHKALDTISFPHFLIPMLQNTRYTKAQHNGIYACPFGWLWGKPVPKGAHVWLDILIGTYCYPRVVKHMEYLNLSF